MYPELVDFIVNHKLDTPDRVISIAYLIEALDAELYDYFTTEWMDTDFNSWNGLHEDVSDYYQRSLDAGHQVTM